MSINSVVETHKIKRETANYDTVISRRAAFKDGAPSVTCPVRICYADTKWTLDDAGNIIGLLDPAADRTEFLLQGDAYASFFNYVLTPEEAKLPVGQFLPLLLDRVIQAHIDSTAPVQ